eukprot:974587-Lingulodinium_polyedra.AAC.1
MGDAGPLLPGSAKLRLCLTCSVAPRSRSPARRKPSNASGTRGSATSCNVGGYPPGRLTSLVP